VILTGGAAHDIVPRRVEAISFRLVGRFISYGDGDSISLDRRMRRCRNSDGT
jgi:hypothetical protein